MYTIKFKDSKTPYVNNGLVLSVVFETCKSHLSINLCKIIDKSMKNGVVEDGWWKITTESLPDRFVRLSSGFESLKRFIENYGFTDKTGCVHYKSGCLTILKDTTKFKESFVNVPTRVTELCGIPQRVENSGICWFSATCFAFFYCKQVYDLVTVNMNKNLQKLCKQSLYNPKTAEELRRELWYKYAFGDDVNQSPELDGQNGCTQFCILASKFDIPVVRIFCSEAGMKKLTDPVKDQKKNSCPLRDPKPNEKHLLILRFYRGNHHTVHKPMRRIVVNGKKYKLASMLLGSMHCGHQIGAASYKLKWNRWAICDSDACMFGIGPIHFHSDNSTCRSKDEWWSHWRHMVPVTIFGSKRNLCDLSPHNKPTGELENKPSNSLVGELNLDLIYYYEP